MKLFELGKLFNLNASESLNKAKELGLKYTGFNQNVNPEDEEKLRGEFEKVAKPEVTVKEAIPEGMKKGAMVGIVHDGEQYRLVSINVTNDEIENRYNYQVLYTSGSIHGALIEMAKKVHRVINPNTVKEFKK